MKRSNAQRTVHSTTHSAQRTVHSTLPHETPTSFTSKRTERETGDKPRRVPYSLHPAVIADRLERDALGITPTDYGTRWRVAWASIVGPSPQLRPGDHEGAALYLSRVQSAIDRGGWTTSEWSRLYQIRDRWTEKVAGRDATFEVIGNRPGGISGSERRQITSLRVIIASYSVTTTRSLAQNHGHQKTVQRRSSKEK